MGNAATLSCQYDLEQVSTRQHIADVDTSCRGFDPVSRLGLISLLLLFLLLYSLKATLYSVRWYFGAEEFYRYVPKETPPTLVFPVSGINVDVSVYIYTVTSSQFIFKNV